MLESRVEEAKSCYFDAASPKSWQPMKWDKSSQGDVLTVYNSPCLQHVFSVNNPNGDINDLPRVDLWRRQHNLRVFEFIRSRITLTGDGQADWNLIKKVQETVTQKLPLYTNDFYPGSMKITCVKGKSEKVPRFRIQRTTPPVEGEEPGTFDGNGFLIKKFPLKKIDFMDNRALTTSNLKGAIYDEGTHFQLYVEVPGVQSKADISLKLIKKNICQAIVTARYPPLLPTPDGKPYTEADYITSTYVAQFRKGNMFLKPNNKEKVDALVQGPEAKHEDGILMFTIPKVPRRATTKANTEI
jgi:hypothetical protein